MKNRIFIFLLTVFAFGTACRDDDDGGNSTSFSGFDRIINKNFRIVARDVSSNGNFLPAFSGVFNCELDDVTRYESSGTASTRYGVNKCSNEPNEEFYFWSLISNDNKLILDYGGPSLQVYNILVNDGITLVLERFTIEDIDGDGALETIQTITTYER